MSIDPAADICVYAWRYVPASICMLLPIHSALLPFQTRSSLSLVDENSVTVSVCTLRDTDRALLHLQLCILHPPCCMLSVHSYGTAVMLGLAAKQLYVMLPVTHFHRFNRESIRLETIMETGSSRYDNHQQMPISRQSHRIALPALWYRASLFSCTAAIRHDKRIQHQRQQPKQSHAGKGWQELAQSVSRPDQPG